MIKYFIFYSLIFILYLIIFLNIEHYNNDNNLNYHNNLSKTDIKDHKTLLIDNKYLKYENTKLIDFLQNNHNSFNKIILLYTQDFNKSDILSKINDSGKLDIEVTEDNLSYFNIYFREKS